MNEHIVVIAGSVPLDAHVRATITSSAIVLGVDSGLDVALGAGLLPSGVIGDLDSVSPAGLAWARDNATISSHPTDKDQTDTELALAFAADMAPQQITLIGGGDRLDHTIAAIGALAGRALTSIPVLDGWWNGQHLDVLHGPGRRTLELEPGSTLSLLAIGPVCHGVSIDGVRWPLDKHRLDPVVGIGVSNEVANDGGRVPVSVSAGVLTIFNTPAAAS